MMRAAIWFVLFLFGAILMSVSGSHITLSWLESVFVFGVMITTASLIKLMGANIWSEEEQQSS